MEVFYPEVKREVDGKYLDPIAHDIHGGFANNITYFAYKQSRDTRLAFHEKIRTQCAASTSFKERQCSRKQLGSRCWQHKSKHKISIEICADIQSKDFKELGSRGANGRVYQYQGNGGGLSLHNRPGEVIKLNKNIWTVEIDEKGEIVCAEFESRCHRIREFLARVATTPIASNFLSNDDIECGLCPVRKSEDLRQFSDTDENTKMCDDSSEFRPVEYIDDTNSDAHGDDDTEEDASEYSDANEDSNRDEYKVGEWASRDEEKGEEYKPRMPLRIDVTSSYASSPDYDPLRLTVEDSEENVQTSPLFLHLDDIDDHQSESSSQLDGNTSEDDVDESAEWESILAKSDVTTDGSELVNKSMRFRMVMPYIGENISRFFATERNITWDGTPVRSGLESANATLKFELKIALILNLFANSIHGDLFGRNICIPDGSETLTTSKLVIVDYDSSMVYDTVDEELLSIRNRCIRYILNGERHVHLVQALSIVCYDVRARHFGPRALLTACDSIRNDFLGENGSGYYNAMLNRANVEAKKYDRILKRIGWVN